MLAHLRSLAFLIQFFMQRIAVIAFLFAAFALCFVTILAICGLAPWLEFPVTLNGVPYQNAGV